MADNSDNIEPKSESPIKKDVTAFKDWTHEGIHISESQRPDYVAMFHNKESKHQDNLSNNEKKQWGLFRSVIPNKTVTLLACIFCLLFGVYIIITSIVEHYKTLNWPAASATVLSSYTEESRSGIGYRYHWMEDQCRDYLKVKYTVSNNQYISKRLVWAGNFINLLFNKAGREATMLNSVQGTVINIYYNPSNPYQFILKKGALPGSPGQSWLSILLAGAIFTIVSLTTLLCMKEGEPSSTKYTLWNLLVNYKVGFIILLITAACILF